MADDRIRELEIMIRLIDIEIILARRREGSEINRVNIVYKSYGIV